MITTIKQFKNFLNESLENNSLENNSLDINAVVTTLPVYQEILDLGFINTTSNIQKARGVLSITSNISKIYNGFRGDGPTSVKSANRTYTIYPNGKLRLSSEYGTAVGISKDLHKPVETIEELNILLLALLKSAKRMIAKNLEFDEWQAELRRKNNSSNNI